MTATPTGKVVLVTGAASGIGAATARHLAAGGHHVVLAARRADRIHALAQEISDDGGSATAVVTDVTVRDDVRAAVDATLTAYGRLDVLVANAGVMPLSRLDAGLVEEWDRMIDVNVRGLLYGIAAVLPVFERQGGGHVVTVASVGAHEVVATGAVYCATKHAAWAITEGLRLESDPSVRVTTITPGVVESELADSISDPVAREGMREYRRNAIAPAAVARAIAFAVDQPADVDVNEIVVRPAAQRP
jgi:NADP-dependent 3-hydroxy acid dehydrogenase YdfG